MLVYWRRSRKHFVSRGWSILGKHDDDYQHGPIVITCSSRFTL